MTTPTVAVDHIVSSLTDHDTSTETSPPAPIPLDRLPDSMTLAGVPLRHLLSDFSGPGVHLRDRLTIHPSSYGR